MTGRLKEQESVRTAPISQVVEKNKAVAEEVKSAADELAVVHAVLQTKLATSTVDDEVEKAVAKTELVEQRLIRSAETLDHVNEALDEAAHRLHQLPAMGAQ